MVVVAVVVVVVATSAPGCPTSSNSVYLESRVKTLIVVVVVTFVEQVVVTLIEVEVAVTTVVTVEVTHSTTLGTAVKLVLAVLGASSTLPASFLSWHRPWKS